MEGPARDRPQPARVGAVVSRTSARMSGSWLVPTRRPAIPARAAVNLDWLIRLRWAQIVGQAVTIVATHVVAVPVPLAPLAALVAVGLLANVVLGLVVAPRAASGALLVRDVHLAGVMALDIGLLTGMLYLTGGPLNPFGSLYLVQIALATVVLPAAWAWALVALSFAGFGALLVEHRPLLMPDATRMIGMWVALGVAAAFIVYFLWRITTALAEREAELTLARNLTARQEKLASLATMAAGAAHELSTPLSTVALVAKELERHLAGADPQLIEDARLIRGEVGRCRVILDQMAGGAGTIGEGVQDLTLDALLDEALTGVRAAPAVVRRVAPAVAATVVRVPPRAISQALRSLVTNAQDASAGAEVAVSAAIAAGVLRLEVSDRGAGITPDVLARLGEPFFTTKAPGRGMGLGLFLARAVVEGVGGQLAIDSRPGRGTTVAVTVPLDVGAPAARGRATTAPAVVSKAP